MIGPIRIIKSIVFLALLLGVTGTLVDTTKFFMNRSVEAHKKGGISFRELNRMLSQNSK